MLPKKNRVDKKGVDLLFQRGKFITSPVFVFKFLLKNSSSLPRISFIVPKNIAKLAVERNSLRRKGYAVLEKFIDSLPLGLTGTFVFKKIEKNSLVIEDEIKNIFKKIN